MQHQRIPQSVDSRTTTTTTKHNGPIESKTQAKIKQEGARCLPHLAVVAYWDSDILLKLLLVLVPVLLLLR
jgi:hypothetical protein